MVTFSSTNLGSKKDHNIKQQLVFIMTNKFLNVKTRVLVTN